LSDAENMASFLAKAKNGTLGKSGAKKKEAHLQTEQAEDNPKLGDGRQLLSESAAFP